jgi:ABC-type multidrug transport system ATPase subunit
LRNLLKSFYPSLVDFKVSSLRAGWKRLLIIEQFGDRRIETDATHLNDGLLRILAVLAQTESDRSMILLDEIENGINQEIVEKLVNVLLSCRQQIIVTTHSPLVLNYLPDQVAVNSVKFIYKSSLGETRVRPFFDIDRIKEKLEYMGAGDAFVDTDLMQLAGECNALDEADAVKAAAETAAASQLPSGTKAAIEPGSINLAKVSGPLASKAR